MKNTVRIMATVLIAALLLCTFCCAVDEPDGNNVLPAGMIRVGLYYGIEAKVEVNLDTTAELGYRIGFYDESRTLHVVASLQNRNVVVAPNTNASLSGGEVCGIHLRLPTPFQTFDEAAQSASANGGFPGFCNGLFYVMIGSYASYEDAVNALAQLGREAEVYCDGGRGVLVLSAESAQPLFLFDYSSTHTLVLSPYDTSAKPVTTCEGNRYYGDFQFNRVTSGGMTVVNCVTLEDYVKGVVPNEMSASWPTEALKAQAVCARTYALKNLNGYRIYGFDVSDDTSSQVYRGLLNAESSTDAACDATAGEVLRYQGELCSVYYFAADGGSTQGAETVWNDVKVPYLRGISDPYEAELDYYCKAWRTGVSHEQFGDIVAEYDENGNVNSVTAGGRAFRHDLVRDFLVLVGAPYNSRHFKIDYQKDSDSYLITGSGFGHNLGMSQWGAYAMAQNHDASYRDILSFYFTGATVS